MPDFVNRHLGILKIMPYTVKIVCQELNDPKKYKDAPYKYTVEAVDLSKLTTEELNKMYLEAQAIESQIQMNLQLRG